MVDDGSRALPAEVAGFPGVRLAEEAVPAPARRATAGPRWRWRRSSSSPTPTARWPATGSPSILGRFAADPGLEVLGGDIRMLTEAPGDPMLAEAFECLYAYNQRDYIERRGFSVTANLAFRRAVSSGSAPSPASRWPRTWTGASGRARWGSGSATPRDAGLPPGAALDGRLSAKWDRNVSHQFNTRAQRGARAGRSGCCGHWRSRSRCRPSSRGSPARTGSRGSALDGGPSSAWRRCAGYRARAMLAAFHPAARGGNLEWNRD